jgi:hypothetical protein
MSKLKLKFAQRVRVKLVPREVSNTGASQARTELNNAINKHKVDIDRACFKKNDSEKHELKVAKALWKKSLKAA